MSDNPFDDAMNDADEQDDEDGAGPLDEFDVDEFIAGLNEGPKTETIGIAVSEEMHALWQELRQSDEVDVDVSESIREHLQNLASRHQTTAEKAGRKLQIDREL